MFDALKPLTFGYPTYTGPEITRMQELIPKELAKYCDKNNNYRCIPKYSFE
jgi:hypothetical protein